MKEIKDLTPADLIEEGRRWVILPGDYVEGMGYRVEVVFEDHPFRHAIGLITNLPGPLPNVTPFFPADGPSDEARRAADAEAKAWCLKHHGVDGAEYLAIISSSMKAFHEGIFVKVLGETPDRMTLQNGFGDEMHVDEEAAIKLYQDLADALDLPCQRTCPECDGIMEGDECGECGAKRAD